MPTPIAFNTGRAGVKVLELLAQIRSEETGEAENKSKVVREALQFLAAKYIEECPEKAEELELWLGRWYRAEGKLR